MKKIRIIAISMMAALIAALPFALVFLWDGTVYRPGIFEYVMPLIIMTVLLLVVGITMCVFKKLKKPQIIFGLLILAVGIGYYVYAFLHHFFADWLNVGYIFFSVVGALNYAVGVLVIGYAAASVSALCKVTERAKDGSRTAKIANVIITTTYALVGLTVGVSAIATLATIANSWCVLFLQIISMCGMAPCAIVGTVGAVFAIASTAK